jgi:exo-beta-1,3-glucanase (GH17 family)
MPAPATGDFCLGADRVATDMEILASMTRRIRTYAINPCYNRVAQILEFAKNNGMTVQLGVWIDQKNEGADNDEINQLGLLVAAYAPQISEVVVGNEFVSIVGGQVDYLARRLREARAMVRGKGASNPVGTAEIWPFWMDNAGNQPVVDECDFIGLQMHAYYSGDDPLATDVGLKVVDPAFSVSEKRKKPVIITETGALSERDMVFFRRGCFVFRLPNLDFLL